MRLSRQSFTTRDVISLGPGGAKRARHYVRVPFGIAFAIGGALLVIDSMQKTKFDGGYVWFALMGAALGLAGIYLAVRPWLYLRLRWRLAKVLFRQ